MQLRKLTDDLTVSPQIEVADIPAIAAAGFKSIVCQRPDGEEANQPKYRDIEAAARAAGIEVRHQPIVSGQMVDADGDEFDKLMQELPKPMLAFCRTGTRSTQLWSLAEATRQPADSIINLARAAGYDMSGLSARLTRRGSTSAKRS